MTSTLNIFLGLVLCCIPSVFNAYIDQNSEQTDELIFAHILFRHGDRNIISTYKNDPWKDESNWPAGFGQLTNLGRQQHFELGAYLRKRYINLLVNNGSYHKDNIYVRSTDVDRTLMSVSHMLAGMFPPMNDQVWNHSLLWQAIPIHTMPEDMDYTLGMKRTCPLYDQAYDEYQQSNEVLTILKNNKTLIKYLEQNVGDKINTICQVKTIYQALWVENLKNFPLPSWTDEVFYDGSDMQKLAYFCFKMRTNTKQLARLRVGFFVREIFERFSQKKDGTLSPDRSLWIYSAHDTTIANILNTLGLFEQPHIPSYASCLFFHLKKRSNGEFYVEIYYKSYLGDDPVPLEPVFIPNCGQKCPLEKLYEIYKDILPTEDFSIECRAPEEVEIAKKPTEKIYAKANSSNKSFLSPAWFLTGLIALLAFNCYISTENTSTNDIKII